MNKQATLKALGLDRALDDPDFIASDYFVIKKSDLQDFVNKVLGECFQEGLKEFSQKLRFGTSDREEEPKGLL